MTTVVSKSSLRSRVLRAVWMSGGGITTAVLVYAWTHSVGWSAVALPASGPALNMVAQAITQPAKAVARRRGSRRGSP